MIGAAAERMVLDLRDALVARMVQLGKTTPRPLADWRIKTVFDAIARELETHRADMPVKLAEAFTAYWSGFVQQLLHRPERRRPSEQHRPGDSGGRPRRAADVPGAGELGVPAQGLGRQQLRLTPHAGRIVSRTRYNTLRPSAGARLPRPENRAGAAPAVLRRDSANARQARRGVGAAFRRPPLPVLQWHDPVTGRRKSRRAGTADPEEAERKRADKEYELNHGLHAEPSRMTWEAFRGLFEAEHLSGARWNTRRGYGDTFDLFERACAAPASWPRSPSARRPPSSGRCGRSRPGGGSA